MKKFILLITAALSMGLLTPTTAEAGGYGRSKVTYSGDFRLTWEHRFAGYDCDGDAVYRWVVVDRERIYRNDCNDGGHGGGYNGGGHYRGGRSSGHHGGYHGGSNHRSSCGPRFSVRFSH